MGKSLLNSNLTYLLLVILLVLIFSPLILKLQSVGLIQTNFTGVTNYHPIEVSAWYPEWDEKDALDSLRSAKVGEVSPFWYRLNDDGKIEAIDISSKDLVKELVQLRNIKLIPTITNNFSGESVSLLLKNEDYWEEMAEYLVNESKINGYVGWDLDWEEVKGSDREQFSSFVEFLANRLHNKNLKLSVSVHAQTSGVELRDAQKSQDLVALATQADEIRIMAYDFHYDKSQPGPVTPINKLQQVLDYTKELGLPKDKVVIALPTYGYDWSPIKGEPLQYNDMLNRLIQQKVEYKLNQIEQSLEVEYAGEDGAHKVWFENAETLNYKIKMVQNAGFYKIALWRLGGEDPAIWELF